jgi:hypothetical protein
MAGSSGPRASGSRVLPAPSSFHLAIGFSAKEWVGRDANSMHYGPLIPTTFPLIKARQAIELLTSGSVEGKIVLTNGWCR